MVTMRLAHDVKIILIHGNGGSTAGDVWYPWLERECLALGLTVINRTFPDNVKARARFWLPFLDELGADENTILVGHSSGAVAALRYAETHRLLGSILVGVCHTDLGDAEEAASGYYDAPWRWDLIRDHQQWIGIYHSTDDPHIPPSEPRHVAAQLRCSYFEFTDRGHFADAHAFSEIVPFLRRKLGIAPPTNRPSGDR
jgi:predicted alpha/beta hydrolase family esterase